MSRRSEEAKYSIAAVSKLTGVSCHSLRIWERRYGFPVPERSGSGHRRYSQAQVEAIGTIAQRAQSGRPVGELIAEYRAPGSAVNPTSGRTGPGTPRWYRGLSMH
jgi:DNA-binding transcriptional MerR regulator